MLALHEAAPQSIWALVLPFPLLNDGITYTAANAQIPAKNILVVVAALCALLFFSTIFLRSWTLPALGLGLWALASLLIGAAWPAKACSAAPRRRSSSSSAASERARQASEAAPGRDSPSPSGSCT